MNTSLWHARQDPLETDPFEAGGTSDVIVVGAGLTGLTTALLLCRAGVEVTVLEARTVGAVTSGHTTAKLSLLQGKTLSDMRRYSSQEVVNAYVEANLEGQSWLLRYLEEHAVPVQHRSAFTYTTDSPGISVLEQERLIAQRAGLDIQWAEADIGLPFPVQAALHLRDQAQFNPMDVLAALVLDLRSRGCRVVEGVRVRKATPGQLIAVHTDKGINRARHLVLATGIPILDRGLHFSKLSHSRSYVVAYQSSLETGSLPQGMYLSVDQPARSVRTVPQHEQPDLLLVGGNAHPVGTRISELEQFKNLEAWAAEHFSGILRVCRWAAQDYQSVDKVPFVGKLPRSSGNIHLATGYNKWGMSNAVAAALQLSSQILGGGTPWAQTLSKRPATARALLRGVKLNATVAGKFLAGWGAAIQPTEASGGDSAQETSEPRHPQGRSNNELPESQKLEGVVRRQGLKPVAMSAGTIQPCRVSAVCTHLGGILSWNDAEETWDCPLHGSRFSATGQVLEGPATRDLKRISRSSASRRTKPQDQQEA